MKAILCQRFGAPDDLVLADIPDPVAAPGEVVAKVAAVGLNFFDTRILAGKDLTKPPGPFSPGALRASRSRRRSRQCPRSTSALRPALTRTS